MIEMGAVAAFVIQAEDVIRDIGVTGVQTCALPIFGPAPEDDSTSAPIGALIFRWDGTQWVIAGGLPHRSEERRVGKECRSRWSPYHYKYNKNPVVDVG